MRRIGRARPESPKVPKHSLLPASGGGHVSKLLLLAAAASASKLLPVMEMFAWGIREADRKSVV